MSPMGTRLCPKCLSSVEGSPPRCPECGEPLGAARRPTTLAVAWALLAAAGIVTAILVARRSGEPELSTTRESVARVSTSSPIAPSRQPSASSPGPAPDSALEPATSVEPVPLPVSSDPTKPARDRSPLSRVLSRSDAVLRIRTFDAEDRPYRTIAGVVIGPGGEVATSYRYFLGAASARAEVRGGVVPVEAVLGEDPGRDLVLLGLMASISPSPIPLAMPEPPGAPSQPEPQPCAALGPRREDTMALGVGSLGSALNDPASGTSRLPYHGLAAAEGAAVLDLDGSFLGFLVPGIESASPRLVIPGRDVVALLARTSRLPVADWNRARYEGSAEAHRRTAGLDLAAGRYAAAIQELRAAITLDASLEPTLLAEIRDADALWERAAREKGDREEALRVLEESVQAFPARGDSRLELARAYVDRRRFREAIGSFGSAMALDASLAGEASAGMADAYSRWADGLHLDGSVDEALAVLGEALRAFPQSPALHLRRGRVLVERQAFADAVADLEAAVALDPSLASQAAPLLEEARRALGGGPIVELRFPPGWNQIPAVVVLKGRDRIVMEVDTGATLTAIAPVVARRLGYDTGPGARIEPVRTASGIVNAAVVTLRSVNLKGFVVTNVEAYVLELPGSSGLLGLNFLNRFRYSVEPERGVLTLQAR